MDEISRSNQALLRNLHSDREALISLDMPNIMKNRAIDLINQNKLLTKRRFKLHAKTVRAEIGDQKNKYNDNMSNIYRNVVKNSTNQELYNSGRAMKAHLKFPVLSPEMLKIKNYSEKLNDFVCEIKDKPKTQDLYNFISDLERTEALEKWRLCKAKMHIIDTQKYIFRNFIN